MYEPEIRFAAGNARTHTRSELGVTALLVLRVSGTGGAQYSTNFL